MLDSIASRIIFVVGGGIAFGGAIAFLVIRLMDKRMAQTKSTAGRCYDEVGKFDNTAKNRSDETAMGGAMGYPMETIGEERLCITPDGSNLVISRTHGADLVARIIVQDGNLAQDIYDCLRTQVNTHGPLPTLKRWVSKKDKLEVLSQSGDQNRNLALLRGHQGAKVVEVVNRSVRSVARVPTETDGRQLYLLLAAKPALAKKPGETKSKPGTVTKMIEEPTDGGSWDAAYGEVREAIQSCEVPEPDDSRFKDDWDQSFR